jgi:hypothetical protein
MADDKVKWKKLTEIYGNARLREHLLVLHNLGVPEGVILKKAPYAKNVADRWIDNIRRRQAARGAGGLPTGFDHAVIFPFAGACCP